MHLEQREDNVVQAKVVLESWLMHSSLLHLVSKISLHFSPLVFKHFLRGVKRIRLGESV